jgi:hypothetical protein
MKPQNLLRRFEYSIIQPKSSAHAFPSRVLYLDIDLKSSKCYLKADWLSIVGLCCERNTQMPLAHPGQVEIGMNIFPSGIVNLNDEMNDGLILFIKGAIADGINTTPCTGMLVFTHSPELHNDNSWLLNFYLYEPATGYAEIKFKFPICIDGEVVTKIFRYS